LSSSTACLLVLEGDRIVHSSWVTDGDAWTVELRRYVSPPPHDAYVYESFTRADARGRGLYPLALKWICHHAARQSQRVWVGVEDDNAPSLRAVTKAGFREALSVEFDRRVGRTTLRVEAVPGEAEPPTLNVSGRPTRA
jgi:RimJ/RimL family protein N-acetyltransferase